jgi:hypothetical protein
MQMARKPQRLLELRAFILDNFLANKTKVRAKAPPLLPCRHRLS